MNAHITRMGWFALVAAAISLLIILPLGKSLYVAEANERTIVRDEIEAGKHNVSGMILVAHTCDELSVQVAQINPSSYYLDFRTWRPPYRACNPEPMLRPFHISFVAPSAGIELSAGVNGRPFSIDVVREVRQK